MALQPPLTLLDQPFSALDLPSIRFVTSWLSEQSQASDRLVLLADYEAPAGLTIAQRIDLG
jgi:ABC-type sulfate/molybdate transport systems ATPase subunit